MKSVVVINYTGAESNWGCRITSRHLLGLIKAAGPTEIARIEIDSRPSIYRRFINKLRIVLAPLIVSSKRMTTWTYFFSYLHRTERCNIQRIEKSDAIILNGEGSLHGLTSELIKFIQYLDLARELSKPVLIVNHSFDMDQPQLETYFSKLYVNSDLNFLRESYSLANIYRLGFSSTSRLVHDAAFLEEVDLAAITPINSEKFVLASGSVVLHSDYRQYLNFLALVQRHFGFKVIFVASCLVDKALKGIISKEYGFRYLDDNDVNSTQVHKMIFDSEIFISGRFHLNILAATAGRIFFPFKSNTCKIEGLLDCLDYPIAAVSTHNFDSEKALNSLEFLLDSRYETEAALIARTSEFRRNIRAQYQLAVKKIGNL